MEKIPTRVGPTNVIQPIKAISILGTRTRACDGEVHEEPSHVNAEAEAQGGAVQGQLLPSRLHPRKV